MEQEKGVEKTQRVNIISNRFLYQQNLFFRFSIKPAVNTGTWLKSNGEKPESLIIAEGFSDNAFYRYISPAEHNKSVVKLRLIWR